MYTVAFHDWWTIYPRKVGKRSAAAKYKIAIAEIARVRKIARQEAREWLHERTKLFAASYKGQSGQFCPHPTTWLNQGRYDDDPSEWQQPSSPEELKRAEEAQERKRIDDAIRWNMERDYEELNLGPIKAFDSQILEQLNE